jgi:protein SCO1
MKTRDSKRPGSTRVPRAGENASPARTVLAIADFPCNAASAKDCFGGTPKPARGTRALPGIALAASILFCATILLAATPQQQIAARAGLEQKLGAQLPLHARFRDEHGTTIELGAFFGSKPVILALAYYECPNLCTLVLNGVLQTAQELKLDAGRDYQIVVVSFDPHEQPALAAAKKQIYVQRYGRPGAASGWHFLTGKPDAIAQLTNAVGYHFAYDETTRQFAHPSTIVVLTPEGRIARYFPGIEYPPRDVRLALIEASREHIGSLADRVFLLCFHYNPATGKYGLLISRIMQIAGIGSALAVAGYIALNLQGERHCAS